MNLTAREAKTKPFDKPFQWLAAANPAFAILLAPILFWVHILEEGPAFVRWLNSITSPPIPEAGFVMGNLPFLLITAALAIVAALIQRKEPALALLVWLSYVMFANSLFHVAATVALRRYCPGLITALALYLPFYFWFASYLRARLHIPTSLVIVAAALASLVVYRQWHAVIAQATHRIN